MKKVPVTLLSAAAVANVALAEDHISVHYLSYEECDDRVILAPMVSRLRKYRLGLDTQRRDKRQCFLAHLGV
ncbi:hypothetical protein O9992_22080 [Vibrio lentus]|nr:hypothetical protein [Vibrio lentus]